MSSYEQNEGKEFLKISSYFKKDYVSYNALVTVLWITLGYLLIIGLFLLVSMETLLNDLTLQRIIYLLGIIGGVYLILVIVFIVISAIFYGKKHRLAKHHVKRYYRDLSYLERLTNKETKKS